MKTFLLFAALLISVPFVAAQEPLRVIVFGAHPDDPESAGGLAALYAQMGHKVKFVTLTNGNKGHQTMKSDELAVRRHKEAMDAGRILGVEYTVMNNSDGELMPTLENRFAVIKLICDWKADIVITHRPNDYHPDHRYTSIIVQDAAYMISVPKMIPDGEPLLRAPVFLYMSDGFQKPTPFSPDIVVDVTPTIRKKAEAMAAHESQMFEWLPWNRGNAVTPPSELPARKKEYIDRYVERNNIDRYREAALNWYTADQLKNVRVVEVYEICEYGSRPNKARIKQLFPMLP